MSSVKRELLLCALHRAGRPLTSGEVEDQAKGLAQAEGWPETALESMTRKSVSGLLRYLERNNSVMYAGDITEDGRSGTVPTYKPTTEYDPTRAVPEAPQSARLAPKESPYNALNKSQLIALLDVHDSLAECHGRFMDDLQRWRDRSRSKLAAAGLDES